MKIRFATFDDAGNYVTHEFETYTGVDVFIEDDEWEIAEDDRHGRLLVRLRSSQGRISRQIVVAPESQNYVGIGVVDR